MLPLRVVGSSFHDVYGREVILRGINLSGDSKNPKRPDVPSHVREDFWDATDASFVGRPFELCDAHEHLARIVSWGYNVVRLVVTWEAVEHKGPKQYDEEYVTYLTEVIRQCGHHGLYVLIDPHQDVWSRFSGGSGAPYWTFLAAGIDPRNFHDTQAAIVHNTTENPSEYPSMIWSSNYDRLAAATMFTLFFAGRQFAPKCMLDGQNIQDYLQKHFIDAMSYIASRIHDCGDLEDSIVIGWESMNEPSSAYLGHQDLAVVPKEQHLRKGTCPSPIQSFLTGSGIAQRLATWDFGPTGPRKTGTQLVDPEGTSIWLKREDPNSKWERNPSWRLGQCIWEQHGVWDKTSLSLLKPQYFAKTPDGEILNSDAFLTHFWMHHFRAFKRAIRKHHTNSIIFCQPPVLVRPPVFSSDDRLDSQIVYSPHYYDGLTLMTKKWNQWYNVDVLGVLRGRYLSPIFAVKFGLTAIRNCLRDQLKSMKQEGLENLGDYPCFFSEIGIPFDMERKKAYQDGNFSSQISALDANAYALEGTNAGFAFWQYSVENTNTWGDNFNGEDLSFYSRKEHSEPGLSTKSRSIISVDREICDPKHKSRTGTAFPATGEDQDCRALLAFARPSPISVNGSLVRYAFDLDSRTFEVEVQVSDFPDLNTPTEVYIPEVQYVDPQIHVSSGRTVLDTANQLLLWFHDQGDAGTLARLSVEENQTNKVEARGSICGWF